MQRAVLLAALLPHLLLDALAAFPVDVTIEYGVVRGAWEANYTAFFAIPFAKPPIDSMRFKSPEPPEPWSSPRDCMTYNPRLFCPQLALANRTIFGQEDCLYLNIYVPHALPPPEGFPVMLWIYGGAYEFGADRDREVYRGQNLASEQKVIVVEPNYRLGPVGFLAHPLLRAESAGNTTGNMGTQDQLAALQFTVRNIRKFGGNPKNIVIFGQSAGALSVCWHLVSPISQTLIAGAIMQSGTCSSPELFIPIDTAFAAADVVLKYTHCNGTSDPLACLRSKPLPTLYAEFSYWPDTGVPLLAPVMPYGPVVDGSPAGLLALPLDTIRAGQQAHVPLMLGTVLDEGSIFVAIVPSVVKGVSLPLTENGTRLTLQHFFNDTTVDAALALYPASAYPSEDRRVSTVLRDFFFACPTRRVAREFSAQGLPVYLYQFRQSLPDWLDYRVLGDYHAIELPFVFGNPGRHVFDNVERRLSQYMMAYWANFAKRSNPNGALLPRWPLYDTASDANIFLELPPHAGQGLLRDVCDFWDVHAEKAV